MREAIAGMLNSPGFNSIVLLLAVWVAYRQLRSAKEGIQAQLAGVERTMAHSQQLASEQLAESRLIAKRKETATLLMNSRGDKQLQRAVKVIETYYNTPGHNVRELAPEVDKDHELYSDRCDVVYLMNHFENVAICIEREIYCRDMIIDAWRTNMVEVRRNSTALIDALRARHNNPNVLIKFTGFVDALLVEEAARQ